MGIFCLLYALVPKFRDFIQEAIFGSFQDEQGTKDPQPQRSYISDRLEAEEVSFEEVKS